MPILLDDYVIESLMPDLVGHDHHPSAFLLYLALWRLTGGGERETVASLRQLAEETGLSRRAVQDAVARLAARQLVEVQRGSITDVPAYRLMRPWVRPGA
jgi:DNA-binding MarR family transcriptional regulator